MNVGDNSPSFSLFLGQNCFIRLPPAVTNQEIGCEDDEIVFAFDGCSCKEISLGKIQ